MYIVSSQDVDSLTVIQCGDALCEVLYCCPSMKATWLQLICKWFPVDILFDDCINVDITK